MTGTLGKANPFRWSTKFTDDETDLVYYGHRYYIPSTGRFLNRDPLGEQGGPNLYAFVSNNPVNGIDKLGLDTWLLMWGEEEGVLFEEAAKTKAEEIKKRSDFNSRCDKVVIAKTWDANEMNVALKSSRRIREIHIFAHSSPEMIHPGMSSSEPETNISKDGKPITALVSSPLQIFAPRYHVYRTTPVSALSSANCLKNGDLFVWGCRSSDIAGDLGSHLFGKPGKGVSTTCYFPKFDDGTVVPMNKWKYYFILIGTAPVLN